MWRPTNECRGEHRAAPRCVVPVRMKGTHDVHQSENAFELSFQSPLPSFVLIPKDTCQSSYREKPQLATGVILSPVCDVPGLVFWRRWLPHVSEVPVSL